MLDIAKVRKTRLGDAAKKVPTRQLPNWLVRVVALFDPTVRPMLPLLDNARTRRVRRLNASWDGGRGHARTRSPPRPRVS